MIPLVGYHVRTRDGAPANVAGLAYDYILGAGGVYIEAENAFLLATVQVAAVDVRGLEAVLPGLLLKPGRIPQRLWRLAFDRLAGLGEEEGIVEFQWREDGYHAVVPEGEHRSVAAVRYEPGEGTVLQLHSHHRMPAYFSATDDADELGFALFGVLGRLDTPRPEVIVRVGVYGSYALVPWDLVFAGALGTVRDLARGEPDRTSDDQDRDHREPEEGCR